MSSTYTISHEQYGSVSATFESLSAAEAFFRALGDDWAATTFRVRGTAILDERGQTVGEVGDSPARALGRTGGRQRTEAQTVARRANGRKGGRPTINVPPLCIIRSNGGDGGWSIHPDLGLGDVEQEDWERLEPVLVSGEATWRDDIGWSRPTQRDIDAAIRAWRRLVRKGHAEAPADDNRHVITEDDAPYAVPRRRTAS